jgi:polyvinyl alcohol dehydrogenase (cytochrome)
VNAAYAKLREMTIRIALIAAFAMAALAADPDGSALFNARCATCHQAQTDGRTPTRAELAALAPEAVANAMLQGRMTAQAQGLAQEEVRAVAAFITGKPVSFAAIGSAANKCSVEKPFNPGAGDWNGWGVDVVNSRFQPRPGLSAADVAKLKLKWAFGFPGDSRAVSQPALVGGRVFVGSNAGTVYSLDAETGCTYWAYEAGAIARTAIDIERGANNQWVAYFGDSAAYTHAVDALTGKQIWKAKMDDYPVARITAAPTFYNGRLYVPVSSGEELASSAPKYECCKFRGSMVALDAATGKVLWKTYTVPDQAKQYKTLADGTPVFGPAGAALWNSPTIDVKRKRLYVGSGNSYTDIELPNSDAILSFDLETGSLLWVSQVTPKDNWVPGCPNGPRCPQEHGEDYDFASSPILTTVNGKDVLVVGQKSGVVYGLDPDQRGKVLWQTRLGQGAGFLGGVMLGMAVEGPNVLAAIADYNVKGGTPGLYALRISDGQKIWGTPHPPTGRFAAQPSAVSAMPGIAFSASYDGHLRAYSTRTGEIVWDFNANQEFPAVNRVATRGGSFNGGGPALSRGLAVISSGYGFAGGQPGNALLAFSVDGK